MRKELTGQRFGKLVVLSYAGSKNRRSLWKCLCDCGNETVVTTNHLTMNNTKSCGCLNRLPVSTSFTAKHGKRNTRLYHIWTGIKQRCGNENDVCYEIYGGRGIKVCPEWLNDFQAFYDWAMSNGYRDDLTIDRINNDGNYEPNNCRWVTAKEQSNNKRTNFAVVFNGKKKTVAELSEMYGIKYITLYKRLRRGWSIDKALNYPAGAGKGIL